MLDTRGDIDAESLLKIVLVLVVVVLFLEVLESIIDVGLSIFGPFRWIVQLIILGAIVLWLLDRL